MQQLGRIGTRAGGMIGEPYLLFLGAAPGLGWAKTAAGILQWRPERCAAQLRLPGCGIDLGLPDMAPQTAAAAGVRTMVIGVVNSGGFIDPDWVPVILAALAAGLDVASGLHQRLSDDPAIAAAAERHGRRLWDVRHTDRRFATGTGEPRSGRRVLTVGTDCVVGKKYAALAIDRALRALGEDSDFRATGQTGVLIAGSGVAIDAVVADFIAGAAEWLSPAAAPTHWDVIEGQGSLFHPAYAGVTLGLIHGSQPDALVFCHEPGRRQMGSLDYPVPELIPFIEANLAAARLTNPDVRPGGVSCNTSAMDEAEAIAVMREIEDRTGLPCVDPLRQGAERIARHLLTIVP
ncbi:N-acetyltransferase DgcN [Sphingomonas sp. DT-204]|uniref:N-acetyltransferase DgcN n=1 Tax=Sphingomonas sp. DT-204 TaxID=3396166 RepID=UPI003F1D024B